MANLTQEEKKKWILENCIDSWGNIDLRRLDFSDFRGDVYISSMKVKGSLIQSNQQVRHNLYQDLQQVEGEIFQDDI